MDIMRKLTLRTMQKNRKRTVVTIVGIILATALITGVANLAVSFQASMVAYEKIHSGDYHYIFQGVSQENRGYFENNRNIDQIGYETDLGYAMLPESRNPDKPYLYIKAMTDDAIRGASISLVQGRLPENDREIVVPRHMIANGGVEVAPGDILLLDMGYRDAGDGYRLNQYNPYLNDEETFVTEGQREYTVVGIMERLPYEIEGWTAPGYTAITYLDNINSAENLNLYVTYTLSALRDRHRVTAGILGIPEEALERYEEGEGLSGQDSAQMKQVVDYFEYNRWLVKWQLLDFSNRTANILYGMCGIAIVIIIVTSVFCIRNSFIISLTEKMRLYGMLASVGTTRKQRRAFVYTEGALLGAVGVPIGVLSGILATFILVKVTGKLLLISMGVELIYAVSLPAILAGAVLSMVTVYLSAGQSAGKAGKLSPITAIRGNETVKITRRKLRTPGIIHRLFGEGGVIAYKNLKRAKVKYRTTVISIVVSVAVFIAMTTFVQLAFYASSYYYEDVDYQLYVNLYSTSAEENYRDAQKVTALGGITFAEVRRIMDNFYVETAAAPYSEQYLTMKETMVEDEAPRYYILALGEQSYAQYCREIGVSPEEASDKAIVISASTAAGTDGKWHQVIVYDYQPGDVISGELRGRGDTSADPRTISVTVLTQTEARPLGASNYNYSTFLIVSDNWFDQYKDYMYSSVIVYLRCEDAYALEEQIEAELGLNSQYTMINTDREYQQMKSLYLLIAIFLYGFLTVIALIGVTNIFNTVTTNMELRAREFAMLKSVGMTNGEFRRMIWLEGMFYGGKSLLIGIPVGCVLSWLFFQALSDGLETTFQLPLGGILISVLAVFVLLFVIMRYSMAKINRKNIIETIRNENI